MVSGRLTTKRDYWYIVLELKHEDGTRYSKWISTGFRVIGNKKRAEEILHQKRVEYTKISDIKKRANGISFSDYILSWLNEKKTQISPSTYIGYHYTVNRIAEYFRDKEIMLFDLKAYHISDFYEFLYSQGMSANGVLHYHAHIHQALKCAVNNELLYHNPIQNVKRPNVGIYKVHPYNDDENKKLVAAIVGEKIALAVLIALHMGLRRSEILGLKWKHFNFDNNTMLIEHAVKYVMKGQRRCIAEMDRLKCGASTRTLPIPESLKAYLLAERTRRYSNPNFCENDYICINDKGEVFKPDYVSKNFKNILLKNRLRPIRFHDLRHGCANLLIRNGVPLIAVQHWLGHSHMSTTADMYIHLTFADKIQCSDIISRSLNSSVDTMAHTKFSENEYKLKEPRRTLPKNGAALFWTMLVNSLLLQNIRHQERATCHKPSAFEYNHGVKKRYITNPMLYQQIDRGIPVRQRRRKSKKLSPCLQL